MSSLDGWTAHAIVPLRRAHDPLRRQLVRATRLGAPQVLDQSEGSFVNVSGGMPPSPGPSAPPLKRLRSTSLLTDLLAQPAASAVVVEAAPAQEAVGEEIEPPATRQPETVLEKLDHVKAIVTREQGESLSDLRLMLLCMLWSCCDGNVSNYQFSNVHKLMIFLIIDRNRWRAHKKQIFEYVVQGAWVEAEGLRVAAYVWDALTAVEGIFVHLSRMLNLA